MIAVASDVSLAWATQEWPAHTARVESNPTTAGSSGRIVVTLEVPEGCHVQSHEPADPFLIPTELTLEAPEGIVLGDVEFPQAETHGFDWTPLVLDVHRGTVEIGATFEVSSDAQSGRRTVSGRIRYQGCTERTCLPPAEQAIEVTLDVI